jgi:hypothetical protein
MGWLFAVALGFQDRTTAAVLRAIVPLALGHIVSVAIIVVAGTLAASAFPHSIVHFGSAAVLIGFGIYRLIRVRHPRWVGMRVGFWGLTLWGFLMSSAHGAGLMLLPFVTGASAATMPGMPAMHNVPYVTGILYIGVHTFGYLATMTAVALIVYMKVGVGFLRTGWFNVDLVWSVALVVTGVIALFA